MPLYYGEFHAWEDIHEGEDEIVLRCELDKREKPVRHARLRLAPLLAAALALAPGAALGAEAYPVKPVRIIVPFPPGGLSDGLARILAQNLTQEWGQQVIIDNRPGAGTTLAADVAAKAAADGYTLFFQDITTHGINAGLYRKLPYDSLKDFAPVAMASASPLVLSVHPSLPALSVSR